MLVSIALAPLSLTASAAAAACPLSSASSTLSSPILCRPRSSLPRLSLAPSIPPLLHTSASAADAVLGSSLSSASSFSLLLADASDAAAAATTESSSSLVDTILDIGVYALLLGVVGLTLYSLYVTLDQSNKEYGGWVKKEDDISPSTSRGGPVDRYRSGAVYDPVTEAWTMPDTSNSPKAGASVGRAPSADADDAGNRYERRMAKKQKQKQQKKK